ncbi:hypothetical protein TNCV_5071431 [Trichonephila clavipes]|nr:hypothetical protein TNCV_5071431 [Trichonephila clavipes]
MMSFLLRLRKGDLLDIAKELGVEVDITLPRIEFKKRKFAKVTTIMKSRAQRVINSGDIGVGSLELIVDKGLTGPEALICENNCKKRRCCCDWKC